MADKNATDAKKKRRLSYAQRKTLYGYGFISLWLVGTLLFFIVPIINSVIISFNNVVPDVGEMIKTWVGFDNYMYVFTGDEHYTQYLAEVLVDMLMKTCLIIPFSLFIAVILNQKFKGRGFARAVFFLPVIIATGPVYGIITGNMSTTGNSGAEQFSTMFETDLVGELMNFLGIYGINDKLEASIKFVSTEIFSIVWNSGIQILIFLAGLQNIPSQAKEAAQLEGATAWEYFWKITFPYVGPMIIANLIFTIIDSFTDPTNKLIVYILEQQRDWQYGTAAAMAWVYFIIVMIVVVVAVLIFGKKIYYEVD